MGLLVDDERVIGVFGDDGDRGTSEKADFEGVGVAFVLQITDQLADRSVTGSQKCGGGGGVEPHHDRPIGLLR
ncbi:hypothetical protein [Herbihabitans rhizosphaerae]|uniref:hypothetical protein n=1 Tax=Herbihabitans rhizosphaerae TaxID=1872711 RepID=UPI00102BB6D0|nr:hypothetical protein [Herbihabitans rhizosphaerae]